MTLLCHFCRKPVPEKEVFHVALTDKHGTRWVDEPVHLHCQAAASALLILTLHRGETLAWPTKEMLEKERSWL